jgi:hypothetical protein
MIEWDDVFYDYLVKERGARGRYIGTDGAWTRLNSRRLFTKPGALAFVNARPEHDLIILRA